MLALRIATALMFAGVVAACDDSTGPGASDLELAALEFNTLQGSRIDAADPDGAIASRVAAVALRTGVRPARVRIAVDGVTEDYWALAVEHALAPDITAGPVLTIPIVARTMVAWRGAPAQRVISIRTSSDTGTFSLPADQVELPPGQIYRDIAYGILFERGGPVHLSVDGGARTTRQLLGDECALAAQPPIMRVTSPVDFPITCRWTQFVMRFNMRVQEAPLGGAAAVRVRIVAMNSHDVPGIRLEYRWLERPCPVCA